MVICETTGLQASPTEARVKPFLRDRIAAQMRSRGVCRPLTSRSMRLRIGHLLALTRRDRDRVPHVSADQVTDAERADEVVRAHDEQLARVDDERDLNVQPLA